MPNEDAYRSGDSLPPVERNRNVKCKGRTVIRHPRDHVDPLFRGQPILDDDGARQYRPCIAWAANGTEHCQAHGGSAPQTINAAKRTLALSAEDYADAIVGIVKDQRQPAELRLKAAIQGLDRVGIRGGIDLGLETPGWQLVLGKMFGVEEDEDAPEPPAGPSPPVAKPRARKAVKPVAPSKPSKAAPRKAAPPAGKPKFEGW